MPFKYFIPLLSFLLLLSSCRYNAKRKILSPAELEAISNEFNLPKEKTFMLDPGYIDYLFSLDSTKYGLQIKNHYQPTQAVYYDKTGTLVSFHINCYAGEGIKDEDGLNWNQQNAFDSFIPKSVAPPDSILPLSKHLHFLRTFDNEVIDTTGFSAFDYTVIIHWAKKWRSDSRNLVSIVHKNVSLAKEKKINILYVNNDNNW